MNLNIFRYIAVLAIVAISFWLGRVGNQQPTSVDIRKDDLSSKAILAVVPTQTSLEIQKKSP